MKKTKIQNLKDLQFYSDIELAGSLLIKWLKLKPKNDELNSFSNAISGIFLWANTMEQERSLKDEIISEYRQDKNRALERARRCEKKVEELELEIERLKKISNL
jgi:hypothetical protein